PAGRPAWLDGMPWQTELMQKAGLTLSLGSWQVAVRRLPPSRDELIERYDRLAQGWHFRLQRQGYLRAYRRLFQRLAKTPSFAALGAGGRVLDCGIGSGALSLALIEAFPSRFHVTGLDLSPRMLEEARWRLTSAGIAHDLYQGDIAGPPFGGAFDLVMGAHLLEHLPDPQEALRHMAARLHPGAPLLIIALRPGLGSSLIHLKHRSACLPPLRLAHWMRWLGLTRIRLMSLGDRPWRLLASSYAAVAVKPREPLAHPFLEEA
ncbi:MAG: methyltransferase domain-containing protein, partial [Chromatiaceae bacterium]|nr:methyltransferase domain-containing protein [Chromatiaceae bacterium]